jgi:molybdopterin molybdotransferase
VSSIVSFELFGRPAIHRMLGLPPAPRPQVMALMEEPYRKTDDRRHFIRVRVREQGGEWRARLTGEQGSGILTSLTRANGIAVVAEDRTSVQPGEVVPVWLMG